MDAFLKPFIAFTNWLWSYPLLLIVIGGGLIIACRLRFIQFRKFAYINKQTFGKIFEKNHGGQGTVTPFQAACTALASSIGAANIVVVPTIIFTAGPGAVFWMWIAAFIGQSTKFAEIVLGIKYRIKNEAGEYVGGACYYMEKGLGGQIGKVCGFLVAFFFMIEILPSITVQTHAAINPLIDLSTRIGIGENIARYLAIALIFVLVCLVVFGGVKRIGKVTEMLVPIMAVIYFFFGLIILILNIKEIPEAIRNIFVGAFNPAAVVGGVSGGSILAVMKAGVARGVYSNEAGMSSAPYGHGAAVTDHPVRQAFWGVFEVTVDTLIVCTMSAFITLVTGVWKNPDLKNIAIYKAFDMQFGNVGGVIVSISLFLFVLSTIIVIVFYVEKLAEYCFGYTVSKIMRVIASLMVVLAAFLNTDNAGLFLDFTLGIVVLFNIAGVVLMSGQVKESMDEFFSDPKYYAK